MFCYKSGNNIYHDLLCVRSNKFLEVCSIDLRFRGLMFPGFCSSHFPIVKMWTDSFDSAVCLFIRLSVTKVGLTQHFLVTFQSFKWFSKRSDIIMYKGQGSATPVQDQGHKAWAQISGVTSSPFCILLYTHTMWSNHIAARYVVRCSDKPHKEICRSKETF